MAALLGQVHKHASSSWIDRLVSLSRSKPCVAPWLTTLRHFSITGEQTGSTKQPIGESDDFFIQHSNPSFNHSHNGNNRSQEEYNVQQRSPEPIRSGPSRGRKPISQPPPHFRENNRESHSFRPRFDDNHDRHGEVDKTNKSSKGDLGFQGRNMSESNRDANQLGDNFLDKFKLGFDNKTVSPSEVEEATRSDPNQPAPESMPQDADEIFKRMKETGLIPNAVAMLDGLCKDGLVQEALKLFGLMREKGTIPEIVVYTAVVEGYTKAHKSDDAKRIFRKMQSTGISPNAFSYAVLIQGLYKCNRLEDAFELCVEMLEAGHSPNVTTFVGLVDGFCKEKGVEEAKGAIKTLIEKGFAVNEKAVREFLDKKAPFSPAVWEAIFGKKVPR
ncbi:hypothetical protein TanjilG_12995 [Lupinus angustifolius]|uniref:Pentacotripeptide-repeat region of PRORP domain-containing protein n=1 Tax=Lupinus angustifolius TaxID=3871 RepID=A0A1J7G387_LUPAN|nr:PREDICTED: pentatricopeptide repeat-containing protein At4g38150 [Lupinus angustifolius]XP_019421445.1 PREDICTED: pentatricopeptide repeat-containing protein At4g38150 [Lupinus angustifolius]OIV94782.1 hypothetical protein TanjilG_12995 [Lupinus angustifolius]